MSRRQNNLKRMKEAKKHRKELRAAGNAERLLDVVRSIPGEKVLTITAWDKSNAVIVAHPDGSLGQGTVDEALFRAKLGSTMKNGGALAIRAFDEAHPVPAMTTDGKPADSPRQMLYGARLGGGKWEPLSANGLRDLFTTCRCCDKRIPDNPDYDYFDLARLVTLGSPTGNGDDIEAERAGRTASDPDGTARADGESKERSGTMDDTTRQQNDAVMAQLDQHPDCLDSAETWDSHMDRPFGSDQAGPYMGSEKQTFLRHYLSIRTGQAFQRIAATSREIGLSPTQAASLLSVSLRTVRRLVKSGALPSRRVLGCRRIPALAEKPLVAGCEWWEEMFHSFDAHAAVRQN